MIAFFRKTLVRMAEASGPSDTKNRDGVAPFRLKFLLFDHDSKFGNDVVCAAEDLGSKPVCTVFRSALDRT
jgi:hypothetical protein